MCPPCIAKFWPSLYDKHTYIILAMNKAEDVLGHHVFQKYPRLYSYDFWVCKPATTLDTLPIEKIITLKNARAWVSMFFT